MDLNILSLGQREDQESAALPGLYIPEPPRRPARGRQSDRLILYLSLEGNFPLDRKQQDQLLARLAQGYYQTPGTSTAAMRTVAEMLNQYLLDRNLRSESSGRQAVGQLGIFVLREGRVYLGQSGAMHGFLISANKVEHFFDDSHSNRGLGQGRAVPITYFQTELKKDEGLLFCTHPPAAWESGGLSGAYGQGPESLRRRLVAQAGQDFEAILIMGKAGSGKVLVQGSATPAKDEPQPQKGEIPARDASGSKAGLSKESPGPARESPSGAAASKLSQQEERGPIPISPEAFPVVKITAHPGTERQLSGGDQPGATAFDMAGHKSALEGMNLQSDAPARAGAGQGEAVSVPEKQPAPSAEIPRRRRQRANQPEIEGQPMAGGASQALPRKSGSSPLLRGMAAVGRGISKVSRAIAMFFGAVLKRLLPGEGTLPASVMAFFAVAIPIMVVAAATYVYLKEGVSKQYISAYAEAVKAAEQARMETAPEARRQAWNNVAAAVETAEIYQVTTESQALRAEAQEAFDELDGVRRLNFQSAIVGGLPADAQIVKMIATDTDLYMLNGVDGNLWRAVQTNRGYEIEPSFACGPSLSGTVGPLIDIALIPKGGELEGGVMGMDNTGNLLRCAPGEQPQAIALAPPPAGWGSPIGFVFDSGNLYVLDPHPQKNAVWVYWDNDFASQPQLFFAEDVPPMKDVIDLAVEKLDLYLLHADGHITLCTFSELGVSPTRCADPVPYSDTRPGREGQQFQPEHAFIQILTTLPPDPSLYLLEPQAQAIYHFSLRLLTFQKQLRPVTLPSQNMSVSFPDKPATAFALSPDNRLVFLALGNQVYYAGMP